MSTIAAVIGRILLAIIFLNSGAFKLLNLATTNQTIVGAGLPSGLALPTGLFELIAGLCLIFGFATRLAAVLLAGFCILTILFFHRDFVDPLELTMALKDLAIAGGLLLVFAHSQMWWSWDRMRAERRGEIVSRDADLRAARAEGAAAVADRDATVVDAGGVPVVGRRGWFRW